MEHSTSKALFDYWNRVRGSRPAPERFEIEPSHIAAILPDTFVVEHSGRTQLRFRLAGSRICAQFGQELRGTDLLDLWSRDDREAMETLVVNVVEEHAVATATFVSTRDDGRSLTSELILLPLLHGSSKVNRMIGAISSAENPYWLGTAPFVSHAIDKLDLVWPDGPPWVAREAASANDRSFAVAGDGKRRFRVYDGGRTQDA
ncbi:MAG: PAS domain-containing protein [Pseudomonadota bacterium]|nr:PAS domain-containing protein [Pseudomonadota bacterium]